MKDLFNRAISLGFGLAAESKEQIEKAVEELVKKGEVSRNESSDMVDELVRKGEEARQKMESVVSERVQAIIGEKKWATKEEVALLAKRLDRLEQLLAERGEPNS
ncbi:Polyhydroxyalkanoate synthesis regulator phasin [Paenibacillus sp. UNCCL117]|uniref:phasin family protein n=1 Tax=unclassified Paenibacillus TaxID=185978 RepID=UPI00088B3412|nr:MULTISPECIES: phasin family protein [unclassified Paenibacillus]SDC43659.1 Polyhydroxyalkanoate synthesis regulator phasin [Paenibacillus sp. cl123]SFW12906.1 Polyhydroxyalkanoate synthesis regulator phasin [Paenibacillus sp. UNCCL117]